MTAPIAPISAAMPVAAIAPVSTADLTGAAPVAGSGGDFATKLAEGLQSLQDLQTRSSDLAVKAATGDLTDVHDYTIAAAEASIATQLTVAVRNKAVEAFNEIMRMQA
ncbi:flagellar hook-basal body complex protein FliE [Luedemannella flava]|uniref:Flagellar hook-basal body complex protein FliE n=1 Tax=Luedemannella flava TaxID=349316 RepID=A0ABN2MFN4_9ACTN